MNYFSEKEANDITMECLNAITPLFERIIRKILNKHKSDDEFELKVLLQELGFILNNISACIFVNTTASFFKQDIFDGCPSVFDHSYLEECMTHNFAKILRKYVEGYNIEHKHLDHHDDEANYH